MNEAPRSQRPAKESLAADIAPALRPPELPARDPHGHKGTFGTVVVIGGQAAAPRVMLGGPALTARAAFRAGCGLVALAMPEAILREALAVVPEATGVALPCGGDGAIEPARAAEVIDPHLTSAQAIAIGPGFGSATPQQQVVMRLISADLPPMVIDADALNCLSEVERFDLDFRASAILTPHPKEFARLAQRLDLGLSPDDAIEPARRPDAAARLAQRLGAVVILKGAPTVVSDGLRTWTASTVNPALATGGSGDVLTGIAASFVAQFHRAGVKAPVPRSTASAATGIARPGSASNTLDLFECARLAVWAHGRAADHWAARHGSAGLLAHELADLVPDVLAEERRSPSGLTGPAH
ncbi:MAG: NAD(P)H-hydrate dehydratase [Phycisphaeraceae bacterium]|nr:NAD(P)H-hydrate dehydratase [Phycisphaeraceae bacterium]